MVTNVNELDPVTQAEEALQRSTLAFESYRSVPLAKRADLLRAIATALEDMGDEWIQTAHRETNLPESRLRAERARTIYQLESYGTSCAQGDWMRISIDTADPNRNPPRPDIRKMMIPLGPVVVFGASNFPFAYSTAGGDTAAALAAGCTVVVKAHPAHPNTSLLAAQAIRASLDKCGLPLDIFQHLLDASFEMGRALVQHPQTAAVGFTGSFTGGKQLFDWVNQRPTPIPVFAEMGSINPVFLLPEALGKQPIELAAKLAASISLGVGQFCTNPGILVALQDHSLEVFRKELIANLREVAPSPMLHSGIHAAYASSTTELRDRLGVTTWLPAAIRPDLLATPQLVEVRASHFTTNKIFHQEVFGPSSILVVCDSAAELLQVARCIDGQLTCSVFGTESELTANNRLIELLSQRCGRLNFNTVPTGVEVVQSMQHGGPFPATTDSRFSAVGSDSILRFVRPIAYQNCPEHLLPDELRSDNPLQIWRKWNGQWTR